MSREQRRGSRAGTGPHSGGILVVGREKAWQNEGSPWLDRGRDWNGIGRGLEPRVDGLGVKAGPKGRRGCVERMELVARRLPSSIAVRSNVMSVGRCGSGSGCEYGSSALRLVGAGVLEPS
jgi:hypothetical protein